MVFRRRQLKVTAEIGKVGGKRIKCGGPVCKTQVMLKAADGSRGSSSEEPV